MFERTGLTRWELRTLRQNTLAVSGETRKAYLSDVHGSMHSVVNISSAITPSAISTQFGRCSAWSETHLLEIACGPGFYACSLAQRYPDIRITGVDLSERLLSRAKDRADLRQLKNCHFIKANVLALSESFAPVDAIVASRLPPWWWGSRAGVARIFSALRPGGRCFIAEPTSALRATPSVFHACGFSPASWGLEHPVPQNLAVPRC